MIRFLFMEKKCLAHSVFGNKQYYDAASKLSAGGVSYDVVRKSNISMTDVAFNNTGQNVMPFVKNAEIDTTQYNFYVKKEDLHLAQHALHR